jgi:hypothetical protein
MPFKDIYFGEYLPDRGGLPIRELDGYLTGAENVRPTIGGYAPAMIDSEVASATAVGAQPDTAAGFSTTTTAMHFVGSSTGLYQSNDWGVVWNDVGRGGYSAGVWDFDLFGTYVIATNGIDAPQFKLTTDSASTDFDDLAGNPPIAAVVARIREHVILGALSGDAYAFRFNAIGDPTNWPTPGTSTALATQAGRRELPHELGIIRDIVGGEKFGLIFQISGITRVTYTGGNTVWQVDTFERQIGTGHVASAIWVGKHCYFASATGFYRTDGYEVENLSKGRIEDAIVRSLISSPDAGGYGYSVAYDSRTNTVMWGGGAAILCYHVAFERFTILNPVATIRHTTLYSVRNGVSADIALSIPHIFDSGTRKLQEFNDSSAVPIAVNTGFIELQPGWLTQVTGVESLDTDAGTIGVKSISNLSSTEVLATGFTSASASVRSNLQRIRKTGRYHAFKLTDTVNGDAMIRGIRVYFEPVSQL